MFRWYGLIETETRKKCLKIVEIALCLQFPKGRKQDFFPNTLFRSGPGGWKRNDKPEGWAKSHGEQWTGSHSLGVEGKSNQRTVPVSRGEEIDSICPEVQNCLWNSDCYVLPILPLSKWEYSYRLSCSHFIIIWWVCTGQMTFVLFCFC